PSSPPGSGSGTSPLPRRTPLIAEVDRNPRGGTVTTATGGETAGGSHKPTAQGGPAPRGREEPPRPPARPQTGGGPPRLADPLPAEAATQVATVVRPGAAAAVATTFSFPLTLMLAVLAFLLVQRYVDRRDPKLRAAPRSTAEGLVEFKDEEGL